MIKYEDEISLESNEAHNIILHQIIPGKKVLEFGSASGRMTKILKEKYGCEIFIVEIDNIAYSKALNFAQDGICGDIESLEWSEIWKDERFDYIIFADVLEHLQNPYQVLKETKKLLKKNGRVFISIPNIAHNDVWMKLYMNHFDYTDIGILDDSHLHFWAEENLCEFERNTDYQIVNIQYKTIPTKTTEQFKNSINDLPEDLVSLLYSRVNGEVYQFILTLEKKEYALERGASLNVSNKLLGYIIGRVYFDRGQGFCQEDSKTAIAYRVGDEQFEWSIKECVEQDVIALRFDPIEGQACVIKKIEYEINNVSRIDQIEICGESNPLEGILLNSEDPYITFSVGQSKDIFISVRFTISKKSICQFVEAYEKDRESERTEYSKKNDLLLQEIQKREEKEQLYILEIERLEAERKKVILDCDKKDNLLLQEIQKREEKERRYISEIERLETENKNITIENEMYRKEIDILNRDIWIRIKKALKKRVT